MCTSNDYVFCFWIWDFMYELEKASRGQAKAMPKNGQTTTQLHSSHMLVNNAQNSPSQASAIHEW